MHREIEKQQCMEPAPKTLVYFYNEAVIQMGFIAFFAVAFPFAPLFSFLTNLLEIKIKLQTMSEYGRRSQAVASNGIGNWMSIIGFISFFAIPINICILLFARHPADRRVGVFQDADTIDLEEQSAMVIYLTNRSSYWTRTNIFLLAFFIEHLVIALKVVIAILIPDVPSNVKIDERRRRELIPEAERKIELCKKENGMEDLDVLV